MLNHAIALVLLTVPLQYDPKVHSEDDQVEASWSTAEDFINESAEHETSNNPEPAACWSEREDKKGESNGWWVGVCEDALDYCGGTSVMVAKEHAGEKVPPAVDFSRSGGNGYAAVKARCTVFEDEEEDLDAAVAEAFERLPLPVPVVVSEPEGL